MAMKNNKKLEKELEKLKRFKSVSGIIQRTEAENALMYSTSRGDQDPADDQLFETMMSKLVSKGASSSEKKELELIEKSSTIEKGERIEKRKKVKLVRNSAGPKIKQHIHAVKSSSMKSGRRTAKAKKRARK